MRKARVLFHGHQVIPAIESVFKQAVRFDPKNVTAVMSFGTGRICTGIQDQCVRVSTPGKAIGSAKSRHNSHTGRGSTYNRRTAERQDNLRERYPRAKRPWSHCLRQPHCYQIQGLHIGPEWAREGSQPQPKGASPVLNLARRASVRQDHDAACQLLQFTRRANSIWAEWNALFWLLKYQMGEPADAVKYMRRAIELEASRGLLPSRWASLRFRRGSNSIFGLVRRIHG
jgi:hypothetical protein